MSVMSQRYVSFNKEKLKKNMIISIIVFFIIALLTWGGVFAYNRYIYREWTNDLIEKAKQFIDTNDLEEAVERGSINRITFLELVEDELLVAPVLHPTNFRIVDLCNYILVDPEFNYEVVIVDDCVVATQMPFIYLIGSPIIELRVGQTFNEPGAFAFDADGTNISDNIVMRNNINNTRAGEYQVTYDITNSSGIRAEQVIRTVIFR